MTSINTDFYTKGVFKHWPKASGEKPTNEQLTAAHALGCRAGVQALHIAMCLRDSGCTVQQFMLAGSCGPAHNKRRELVGKRLLKVDVVGKPYAYVAKLTDKGTHKVAEFIKAASEAPADADAKPVKKAKAKRKATKVEPVETEISDTAMGHDGIVPQTELTA